MWQNRYITAGFGIYRKLTGTYGSGEPYRNPGVDYIVNAGDKALAANNGKVIYVGDLTLTGNTVIIDHGFGLKSLYAYLGEIEVKVGDMVKTGDTIGTVGTTGFTAGYGFQYRLYVNNIPVCPYSLWEQGIPMTGMSNTHIRVNIEKYSSPKNTRNNSGISDRNTRRTYFKAARSWNSGNAGNNIARHQGPEAG